MCTLNNGGCVMSTGLRSLSNQDLLHNTKSVVARERGITIEVLDHLNEVERRELHLELGHSSMFAYCTDELGYSASATKRRLCTARCITRFPDARPLLEANEINLSTVTQVSRILKPENAATILERIRGKSQREVEEIIAEHEPLAGLPQDRARTVVLRVPVAPKPVEVACMPAVQELQDRNGPEPEPTPPPTMKFERHTVVQFTAREGVFSKLEHVRLLASHRLPANASLEELIEFLADYFTQREDPKRRHERREAKHTARREAPAPENPRQIPAQVRDDVFVRDQGQCTFVGDHKRCGSAHALQLDHVVPVALGGSGEADNLRLLCAKHNRLEAERLMGARLGGVTEPLDSSTLRDPSRAS
jgi:5-methylcytosine-specific restriction endonuclease McrA